jgi:O-antigen/teichoic acid export membrane protein
MSAGPAQSSLEADNHPAKESVQTSHWSRRSKIVARLLTVQFVVQLLSAITGFLLVRTLPKQEYALFTIAIAIQTALSLLADSGVNAGLLSIGGRVWHSRVELGNVIAAALRLRAQLGTAGVAIVLPFSLWLLIRNGASVLQALALSSIAITGVYCSAMAAAYGVVTRLHSRYRNIQAVELGGSIVRLGAVATAVALFLNSIIATASSVLAQVTQYFLVRRQALRLIELPKHDDRDCRGELLKMVRSQWFYFAFYALQGQLTVFLISIYGSTAQVAEIGALSRLGILSTAVAAVVNQALVPSFARIHERHALQNRFLQSILLVLFAGVAFVIAGYFFNAQILWVFGPKYHHLNLELVWMLGSVALGLILSVVWGLNTARGWLQMTWLMVPLTIGTQLLLVMCLDLSTVRGVVIFAIVSQVPNLLVSLFMTTRGFRTLSNSKADALVA